MPVPPSVEGKDTFTVTSVAICRPVVIARVGPLTDGPVLSAVTVSLSGAVRVRSLATPRMVTVPVQGFASDAAVERQASREVGEARQHVAIPRRGHTLGQPGDVERDRAVVAVPASDAQVDAHTADAGPGAGARDRRQHREVRAGAERRHVEERVRGRRRDRSSSASRRRRRRAGRAGPGAGVAPGGATCRPRPRRSRPATPSRCR